eukprot:1177023-Prymnesium_polylepis.1
MRRGRRQTWAWRAAPRLKPAAVPAVATAGDGSGGKRNGHQANEGGQHTPTAVQHGVQHQRHHHEQRHEGIVPNDELEQRKLEHAVVGRALDVHEDEGDVERGVCA